MDFFFLKFLLLGSFFFLVVPTFSSNLIINEKLNAENKRCIEAFHNPSFIINNSANKIKKVTKKEVDTKADFYVPGLLLNASVSNATPNTSEQFCYKIKYRCASITEHCKNAQIQFELHGSMRITNIPDAVGNISNITKTGNSITIDLASPPSAGVPAGTLAAGSAGIIKVCAVFKCVDDAAPTVAGNTVNFVSNPTFSVTGGSVSATAPAITVPTLATCPVTLPSPPPNSFEKDKNSRILYQESRPGSFGGWEFEIPPSATSFTITDNFPTGFRISDFERLEDGYILEVDCGGGYQVLASGWNSSYDKLRENVLDKSDYDDGDFVLDTLGNTTDCIVKYWVAIDGSEVGYISNSTALKLTVPANDADGATFDFEFYVEEDLPCGTYQNVATTSIPGTFPDDSEDIVIHCTGADAILNGGCTEKIVSPLTDDSYFDEVHPYLTVDPLDIQMKIQVANANLATENITQGFVVEALLDEELSFITDPDNPNYWTIHKSPSQVQYLPACANPAFEHIPNHSGVRTLLRWTFPPSCILEAGYTDNFIYNTSGKNRFPEIYFSSRYNLTSPIPNWMGIDITFYLSDGSVFGDNDTSISRRQACGKPSGSSVNSAKYVQGAFDEKMHRYPLFGNTNLTGDGDFELYVYQSGFDDISEMQLVDILPYIGDVDILAPSISRGSEWSMELSQAITVERYKIGTGLVDATSNLGANGVYYSTSTNPCILNALSDIEIPSGTTGTHASCNTFTTGGTAAGARSWGFHWSNTGDPLVFGEYLKITMKGIQLTGEPDKTNLEVAWNSFAFSTTNTDGDVLTSQPIKVGLKIVDPNSFASVGGRVWKDANANGVQDIGETGMDGVAVSLFYANGDPVQDTTIIGATTTYIPRTTVTTDSLGNYRFIGLPPSTNFIVRLTEPANYVGSGLLSGLELTTVGVGTDETVDSDGILGDGGGLFGEDYPEILTVLSPAIGIEDSTFSFGFYQAGQISGHAFLDADLEGDEDISEADLDSIIVIARDLAGTEIGRDTTDTAGNYLLYLPPGVYDLEVDLSMISGLTYTAANITGEDVLDSDVNGAGIISAVVLEECGSVNSDQDIGLRTPPPNPATIEGRVWDELGTKNGIIDTNEPFLNGITVQLLDDAGFVINSTTTDATGAYQFTNIEPNMDYQIQFIPSNTSTVFTSAGTDMDANTTGLTVTITPNSDETISAIDAGLCGLFSLGNLVFHDIDNNGLFFNEGVFPNLTVYLIDGTDGTTYLDTTTTDVNGKYVFTSLDAGDYIVEVEIPTGGYQSSTDIASTTSPNSIDSDDNGNGIAATGRVQSNIITLQNTAGTSGDANWTETDHGQPINNVIDNTSNSKAYYTVDFGFRIPIPCELQITSIFSSNCAANGGSTYEANWNIGILTMDTPDPAISFQRNSEAIQSHTLSGNTDTLVLLNIPADGGIYDTIKVWFTNDVTCADTFLLKRPLPCPAPVSTCSLTAGCLGGNAFEDFNCNGTDDTYEPGVQGVQVVVYDCENNAVATVWTDSEGDWQVCSLTDGAYRVEFILPESIACWATPTHAGSDNGTDVQFLTVPACTKFSLSSPADYCHTQNPLLVTPCYVDGDPTGGGNSGLEDWAVGFSYDNSGAIDNGASYPAPSFKVNGQTLGATWGMAYHSQSQSIFTSALIKRHTGLGIDGTDAIYRIDLSGATPVASSFINLSTYAGINTGADPRDGSANNTLNANYGTNSRDLNAFDVVGKTAIGDIDISADGNTLYAINLNDRTLVEMTVGTVPTVPATAQSYSIIDKMPTLYPNGCSSTDDYRPWALKFHRGLVYVGVVCSAETSQTTSELHAYIISFDPANPSNGFSAVFDFDLNYTREDLLDYGGQNISAAWRPWITDWSQVSIEGGLNAGAPQPILSDIEFDIDGSLVIGLMDRFGHQSGFENLSTDLSNNNTYIGIAGGDVIRACKSGTGFQLEGGAGCAYNGTNEYYDEDFFSHSNVFGNPLRHGELSFGTLALMKGKGELVTGIYDPYYIQSGGVIYWDNQNGNTTHKYELYNFDNTSPGESFGKANGLGDLELLCDPAPLEIGNLVWCDSIENGIQDACERGIDNMLVQLYNENGRLVGQDTTVTGNYYFNQNNVDTTGITVDGSGAATPDNAWSGMDYNTKYYIVFGNGQYNNGTDEFTIGSTTYTGITEVDVNSNGQDKIDSDIDANSLTTVIGSMPANLPAICMTTATQGCGDHKYDMGILCATCPTLDSLISDRVICSGDLVDTLAVVTTVKNPDSIAFVYFTTAQTDSSDIYSNGVGIDTIQVATNKDTVRIFNISGFTNTSTTPDTFFVYGIAHPTPSDITCRPYEEILVIVQPNPTATVADILKCTSNSEIIMVDPIGGATPYTYQWSGPFIGTPPTSQSFSTSIPGTYSVIVTDAEGCTTTASGKMTFQSKVCLPATFTIRRGNRN